MNFRSLLPRRAPRLPSPALVVAVMALVAALGGGFAYAQGGGGGAARLTQACVENGTQILRLTRVNRCPPGSHLISWGERGEQGPAGAPGPTGAGGPIGVQGPTGAAGPIGPHGAAGAAGAAGANGEVGPAGAIGPAGPQGDAGAQGGVGPTGPKGSTGPAGPTGPTGQTGATGAIGPAGAAGISGLQKVSNSLTISTDEGATSQPFVVATCPAGKELIGGGAYANNQEALLTSSSPEYFEETVFNESWVAYFIVPSTFAQNATVTITAIGYCANP
jgi:hypothetical protein